MIACSICNQQIAPKAWICPHCGRVYLQNTATGIFWIGLILLLLNALLFFALAAVGAFVGFIRL